jgi:perosamine synthetase
MKIPLSAPDVNEEEIQAVAQVLRTPSLSLGPKLEEFERSIADYVEVREAIAVNSGTSGLHLSVRALNIREGDEVIVPSFTFIAVANVIRYERAKPVFVDIEPETLNMDPNRVESAVTPQTKAIVVVHTFGCPANLEAILEIAQRHHLYVIEDACEAIGAEYDGRKVGAFGDVGVFAFYPNKQITTGEGGIVVTRHARIARLVRQLRNQGRNGSGNWYQHSELGYNYRISDINCTLGIEQLKRVDSILARREAIAQSYSQRLTGHRQLVLPPSAVPLCKISWFVYVVRLSQEFSEAYRDRMVQEMEQRGIGVGRYFAPIHLQPLYKGHSGSANLPITEQCASRAIALPFFNRIQEEQIEEVCGVLVDSLANHARPLRDEIWGDG